MGNPTKNNQLFVAWLDFLRQEYETSHNKVYRAIGISTSKGAKIRSGALTATDDDLLRMVETFPALIPMAEKENLPVGKSTLTSEEKIALGMEELKRLRSRIDDLSKFLGS